MRTLVLAVLALAGTTAWATPIPTTGRLDVLVVLASFADRPLGQERAHFVGAASEASGVTASGNTALVDRLVAYYAEASSGRLEIVPHVAATPVVLPQARARYVQRAPVLARQALDAFARTATDPADRAALARARIAIVFFAGAGRESHLSGGAADDPWSNYVALVPPLHQIGDVCVIAETEDAPFESFGVLCHEFGHALGLPELYAPGGKAHEGIGVWGLMGQGTWLGRGSSPPHPSAWEKAKLGWVDVETIDQTTLGVTLPAVEDVPRVVKIPAVPGRPEEDYLLENRQQSEHDAALPGDGILVWHVDERVGGFRSAQLDPTHKMLHLVEADGRGDLDRGHAAGGNRGDEGDAWSGPPRWRRVAGAGMGLGGAVLLALALLRLASPRPLAVFTLRLALGLGLLWAGNRMRWTPVCGPDTPGMAPYGGEPVRVVIRNFSPSGPEMRFDVLIAPSPPGP
jgi:immune inhibitor A